MEDNILESCLSFLFYNLLLLYFFYNLDKTMMADNL